MTSPDRIVVHSFAVTGWACLTKVGGMVRAALHLDGILLLLFVSSLGALYLCAQPKNPLP